MNSLATAALVRNGAIIAPRLVGYHFFVATRQFGAGRSMSLIPVVPKADEMDIGAGKKFQSYEDKYKLKVPLPPEGTREREWVRPELDWTPPFFISFITLAPFWVLPIFFPYGIV